MIFTTCSAVSSGCGFCIKTHLTCEDFLWLIVVVVVVVVVVVFVPFLPVALVSVCEAVSMRVMY